MDDALHCSSFRSRVVVKHEFADFTQSVKGFGRQLPAGCQAPNCRCTRSLCSPLGLYPPRTIIILLNSLPRRLSLSAFYSEPTHLVAPVERPPPGLASSQRNFRTACLRAHGPIADAPASWLALQLGLLSERPKGGLAPKGWSRRRTGTRLMMAPAVPAGGRQLQPCSCPCSTSRSVFSLEGAVCNCCTSARRKRGANVQRSAVPSARCER